MGLFRRHLTAVAGVMLTLAVGIALGAGPLSLTGAGAIRDSAPAAEPSGADADISLAQGHAAVADELAGAGASALYAGRLASRRVVVIGFPGADPTQVEALVNQVTVAGGEAIGPVRITGTLLADGQKNLVDTLGSQIAEQYAAKALTPGAEGYLRLGELLGLAVASDKPEGRPLGDRQRAIADSLTGGGMLRDTSELASRAPLVLAVLPATPEQGADPARDEVSIIAGQLLLGLSRHSVGTVAVGDLRSGSEGVISALRAEPSLTPITTVDGVETVSGRVIATLSLIAALTTQGGSFGASGGDPLPLG